MPTGSRAGAPAADAARPAYGGSFEMVAPSLSVAATGLGVTPEGRPGPMPARGSAPRPGRPAATRPLAAWSPLVPFAAAQAALVFAGALDQATDAGLATAERSPILGALALVSPSELSGPEAATTRRFGGAAPRAAGRPGASAVQAQLATTLRQLEAVRAQAPTLAVARTAPAMVTPPAPTGDEPAGPGAQVGEAAGRGPAPVAADAPAPVAADAPAPVVPTTAAATTAATTTTAAAAPSGAGTMSPAAITSVARQVAGSPAASGALRAIELLTRAAAGGAMAEPVAGPRVVLPAGLGGLIVGVDNAGAMNRPMAAAVPRTYASAMPAAEGASVAPAAGPAARAFAPVWAMAAAGTGALGAVASERPAAIDHVAWADRWLARFAGASTGALAAMDAVAGPAAARAQAAPQAVYVAPEERGPVAGAGARPRPHLAIAAPPAGAVAPPVPAAPAAPTQAPRFDDSESVPDDVFAAIMAPPPPRAAGARRAGAGPRAAGPTPVPAPFRIAPSAVSLVDRIATSAPGAPDAGLLPQLASSPVAPALLARLALPMAPSFNPRALYGGRVAASYLGGVLAPGAGLPRSVAAGQRAAFLSGFAPSTFLPPSAFLPGAAAEGPTSRLAALAPGVDYVAPAEVDRPGAPGAAPTAGRPIAGAAPTAGRPAASAGPGIAAARPGEPIALRSSLLAPSSLLVSSPLTAAPFAAGAAGPGAPAPSAAGSGPRGARTSLDRPLAAPSPGAWTPELGATAAHAETWATEQERASADLAFDFVPPELVLAARVYGFGPVEAAQAQRLAIAGPTGLAAMATALDLTFLRAVQAGDDAGRGARSGRGAAGRPVAPSLPGAAAGGAVASVPGPAPIAPVTAYPPVGPGATRRARGRSGDGAVARRSGVAVRRRPPPAARCVPVAGRDRRCGRDAGDHARWPGHAADRRARAARGQRGRGFSGPG